MVQQQNFSLEALAKRDAQDDPFGTAPEPANDDEPTEAERAQQRSVEKAALRQMVRDRANA
jgi:hypothetical protein